MARDVQSRFYDKASRYTTSAFMRLKLGDALQRREMAPHVFETAQEAAARGPLPGDAATRELSRPVLERLPSAGLLGMGPRRPSARWSACTA